jgi:alpha-L-fucosidase 2
VDQSFVEKVKAARKQLPPSQVGDTGELQEWIGDCGETEAKYRHLSLLDGQYPRNGIGSGADAAIMRAVRRSSELRGEEDGHGSSSRLGVPLCGRTGGPGRSSVY